MFETEDLVLRKNEKNFILTLLEVSLLKLFKSTSYETLLVFKFTLRCPNFTVVYMPIWPDLAKTGEMTSDHIQN